MLGSGKQRLTRCILTPNAPRLVMQIGSYADKEIWLLVAQLWCHQDAMDTFILSRKRDK